MNIYDEAIKRIEEIYDEYRCAVGIIENALERAKKVEELLELYQYLWKKPLFEQKYSLDEIQKMIDELEEELK